MTEKKKWYTSRTVWGAGIVLTATAAQGYGYAVGEVAQEQVVDYIMTIVAALGGLLAIFGRVKAEKEIE